MGDEVPTLTTPSQSKAAPTHFARSASGLIRSASIWDVIAALIGNTIFILGIAWMLQYIGLYPGANTYVSFTIALVCTIPITVMYMMWAGIMPRSGGDYVYVSRVLHPSLGFAGNFTIVVALFFWTAFGGIYFVSYALSPALVTAGLQLGNDSMVNAGTWLQNTGPLITIAIITLFGTALLHIFGGTRAYFIYQKWAVAGSILLMAICVIYPLFADQAASLANLDKLFAGMGAASATSMVAGQTTPFTGHDTFFFFWWTGAAIMACFYTAYMGGEVKQPGKTQMLGGMASLAYVTLMFFVTTAAMFSWLGRPFFPNLSDKFATSTMGPSFTPSFITLVAGAIGNAWLSILLYLLLGAAILVLPAFNHLIISRCIFAWSMDQIWPRPFANVNKIGTPTNAVLMSFVGGSILAIAYGLGWFTVLGGTMAFFIPFYFLSFAGVLLPYRRKDLWESSPYPQRFLGIPVVSIVGVLSIITVGVCNYVIWVDPNYGLNPKYNLMNFLSAFIMLAGGFVIYFVARAIGKSRGIDVSYNFAEIPPE